MKTEMKERFEHFRSVVNKERCFADIKTADYTARFNWFMCEAYECVEASEVSSLKMIQEFFDAGGCVAKLDISLNHILLMIDNPVDMEVLTHLASVSHYISEVMPAKHMYSLLSSWERSQILRGRRGFNMAELRRMGDFIQALSVNALTKRIY